ncbi:MAG: protein kinase [bacterium]|nr:protein kinase [bacterium]
MTPDLAGLVARARTLDKAAVATLVSLYEDQRPSARAGRAVVQDLLDAGASDACVVLGVTGSPGSGKSSLIGRLAAELVARDPALSVAVLAVDPSSPISGGALLGDRTRMRPSTERRLFFRSQASARELGGLGPATFQVCRLLSRLFDSVILETVGVGQSEADVRLLADEVYLVLTPLGGDEVQLLKAGIIEIPDVFVVNKCDEPSADRAYHQLRASLWLARPFDAETLPIHRTSARTGAGMDALVDAVLARIRRGPARAVAERAPLFFTRWVQEEWGRAGVAFLEETLGGSEAHLAAADGFDRAQLGFSTLLLAAVRQGEAPGTTKGRRHVA